MQEFDFLQLLNANLSRKKKIILIFFLEEMILFILH